MKKTIAIRKDIYLLGLVMFLMFIASCNKKKIGPQFEESSVLAGDNYYILNEGNFGFSNATVSAYNPHTKEVNNNVYYSKNNLQLGDVAQSMFFHQGEVFIVLNNSGKIIVADSTDLSFHYQINGLNSPRYLYFHNQNLFISDLNSNKIVIYNLQTKQKTKEIHIAGWVEQFIEFNNHLYFYSRGHYLNNQGNNKLYKYDLGTEMLTDSLVIGFEPNSIVLDKDNYLWVLCSGGINQEIPRLQQVDLSNFTSEKDFSFNSVSESPIRLVIDEDKSHLYFLNQHLYRMSIYDNQLPVTTHIKADGRNFYGLAISPENEIYLTDAIDYQQKGKVYRYYENGELIDEFETGIIPQHIAF